LVILPYLSEDALRNLERHAVSGVDLCGNGLFIAPDFYLWRSGYPNLYKDARPIQNPFKGESSIFARCFLLRSKFGSLAELQEFARSRLLIVEKRGEAGRLALSTASKVARALSDELIVSRKGNSLILQDPGRLLSHLRRSAERKAERSFVVGKTPLDTENIWERLDGLRREGALRSVMTGLSSAGHYRLLSGLETPRLYVSDLRKACEVLEIKQGRGFANIHLYEDRKNLVFFDARSENRILWSSPIQTWLELATAGPREQEAADEMEHLLLENRRDLE
jgi:hypothetical protein